VELPAELRGENAAELTEALLAHIQRQFYPDNVKLFHRDRRLLLKAVTWPATWLREKGFNDPNIMPADDYRRLIMDRINDVKRHGDFAKYGDYFPGYLMKCIQNWFLHQGDGYYDRLKSARNVFEVAALKVQRLASRATDAPPPIVDVLAAAHAVVNRKNSVKRPKNTEGAPQLALF
jgi:hypothetical protein